MAQRILSWLFPFRESYAPGPERHYKLPEEIEEDRLMSLDMHYGDEPMFWQDPPEWPWEVFGSRAVGPKRGRSDDL